MFLPVKALVLLASVADLSAQAPGALPWHDWSRTYSLKAGRKVRVETLRPKSTLRGRFAAADAAGISIELEGGRRETIARENVRKVLAERERVKYAPLVGMAAGAATFGLWWAGYLAVDWSALGGLVWTACGAGLGALAGWGVGALGRHALIYEAPKPGRARPKPAGPSPPGPPPPAEAAASPDLQRPDDPKPPSPRPEEFSSPSSHSTGS